MDKLAKIVWDKAITRALLDLDFLILSTPTGELRNKLTEANMALMQAQELFSEIRES
jgi:hypothetical protein